MVYRAYLQNKVPANKWAKNDATKEEIDTHFQFVMEAFQTHLYYLTGFNGFEKAYGIKRQLPSNTPLHLTDSENDPTKLYIPYFVELVDYIGLHCWKHTKNIAADEYHCEAPQLIHEIDHLIKMMQLQSIFTFAKLVRMHHPIALSSIMAVYNASIPSLNSDGPGSC
jgi:hypothetical protein